MSRARSLACMQVSGWFVMTTADVRRVAGPWLRYSEDVRLDPEVRLPMPMILKYVCKMLAAARRLDSCCRATLHGMDRM